MQRRPQLFAEQRLGIVVGAHAPLFHHHADFLGKILGPQHQVVHAVRFQLQGQR